MSNKLDDLIETFIAAGKPDAQSRSELLDWAIQRALEKVRQDDPVNADLIVLFSKNFEFLPPLYGIGAIRGSLQRILRNFSTTLKEAGAE